MGKDTESPLLGGRYRLTRQLGTGPEATTWLARDETAGDACVVKVMLPGAHEDEAARTLFRNEAESLRAVAHPNLVPLRDVILEPERGVAALVMPRVPGEPLDRLVGHGTLPPADIAAILVDCARGLGALHQRGLLHRDLHPRNVVVAGPRGKRRAVIVDFGLVTVRTRDLHRSVSGTLGYLAPESLLSGAVDARTDLYSLGAILYFMVVGEPPLDPRGLLDSVARGLEPFAALEARVAAAVPEPFRPLAGRLLARYPAARYQSAAEVVEAVNLRCGTRYEVESADTRRPALGEPPFFGRTAERRAVFRHLLPSLDGDGAGIAAVRGGRGTGKSRLLAETRRAFEFRGVPVLLVAPRTGSSGAAGPVMAALRALRHRLSPGCVALLDRAEAMGADPEPFAPLRDILVEAVTGALSGPPRGLLVVDDADLLDPASWEILARFLFGPSRRGRAALLSLSAEEGAPPSASRARIDRLLSADPGVRIVDLPPLARAAQEDLVRSLLPIQNLAGDVVRRIADVARGNPAAVIDVVRSLIDSGRVVYAGGGWVLKRPGFPLPVPRSAADAAKQRMASLPAEARRALEVVGLLGGGIPAAAWPRLLEAAGSPRDPLPDLLERNFLNRSGDGSRLDLAPGPAPAGDAAGRREAERIAGAIAAAEPTIDPVVRCGALLAAGRAAEAGALAGAALAVLRREVRLEEGLLLAQKVLAAFSGGSGWLLEGARIAADLRHPEEARAFLREGLRSAGSPAERHALLAQSAELEAGLGRLPSEVVAQLESEGAAAEPLAQARIALAKAHFVQGRSEEALAALGEVLPVLGPHPHLHARALNGLSTLLAQMGRLEESGAATRRALDLARAIGDAPFEFLLMRNLIRKEVRAANYRLALRLAAEGSRALAYGGTESDEIALLLTSVSALEGLGRWRTAGDLTVRIVELAEEGRDPVTLANAWRRRGTALGMLGRQEEAVQALTRSLQIAGQAGLALESEHTTCVLAELFLERGETDRARACLSEAPVPSSEGSFSHLVLSLRLRGKEGPAACREIRAAVESTQAQGFPEDLLQLRLLEVEALRARGREGEARSRWADLLADARRRGSADILARCLALSSSTHAGNPAAALAGMRRAVRLARRLHGVLVRAEVLERCGLFFRGLPGEERLARECLDEAASLFGSASLPGRAAALQGPSGPAATPADWRGLRPEKLAWVLDRTEEINQVENPEEVLAALLDSAIAFTGAERGFLVLAVDAGFEVRLARSIEASEIGTAEGSLSASLVKTCLEKGVSVLASNAGEDERFSGFFSVRDLQLRSILVVPILRGPRVLGAFYLDNRFLESVFSEQDRMALERFASQAALAFENVRYRAEVRDLAERLQGRVEEQSKELATMKTTVRGIRRETKFAYGEIFRGGGSMAETLQVVDRAVESSVSVLLEGESGTGKELVARAIHFHGPLRGKPFVIVNCSAIPETLLESELFGHRKGAFTGADLDRIGRFEEADGGTLFLDEVGDLPLSIQPKILRAVQFGEIAPLGGGEARRVQVRIVAATNRDLRKMMEKGTFRDDLYYRLAVFPIRIPPLRERAEDIPDLAAALVRRYSAEAGKGPRRLSRQAVARLLQHGWPGNIRELENVLLRAVLMTPGDVIEPEDLPPFTKHGMEGLALLGRLKARVAESLRPRDEIAVRKALERGRFTLREFVAATRVSKATATRDLRRLVSLKVLVRRGITATARYELSPRLTDDERVTPDAPGVT